MSVPSGVAWAQVTVSWLCKTCSQKGSIFGPSVSTCNGISFSRCQLGVLYLLQRFSIPLCLKECLQWRPWTQVMISCFCKRMQSNKLHIRWKCEGLQWNPFLRMFWFSSKVYTLVKGTYRLTLIKETFLHVVQQACTIRVVWSALVNDENFISNTCSQRGTKNVVALVTRDNTNYTLWSTFGWKTEFITGPLVTRENTSHSGLDRKLHSIAGLYMSHLNTVVHDACTWTPQFKLSCFALWYVQDVCSSGSHTPGSATHCGTNSLV